MRPTPQFRLMFDVLHALRDEHAKDIATTARVSLATIYAWRSGRTTSPRMETLCRVAQAAGLRFALVPDDGHVRGEVVAPLERARSTTPQRIAHARGTQ